ncbi:hypothetical protein [Rhizobium sp. 18065]|uniref:hypothetical protein n=1 Tax=Rhizobium sp. 18065 TaxID=2681411 RepID=UPI0013588263|nr:hypothetical protein [Rhizobium sp. 18065]
MKRASSSIVCASLFLFLNAPQAQSQSGNPMWTSGYTWECRAVSRMLCERDGKCSAAAIETASVLLDYQKSVVSIAGKTIKIRRHFAQTIAGSPLQAEVKIELEDNTVIWLTAVDASRVYSMAWIGALIEQKSGVVLTETESLACLPS